MTKYHYLKAGEELQIGDEVFTKFGWALRNTDVGYKVQPHEHGRFRRVAEDEKKYRMLEEGEVFQEGDEVAFVGDEWGETARVGGVMWNHDVGRYRRPIDKEADMDGWRMLSGDEVAQYGDEYRYNSKFSWYPVSGIAGQAAGTLKGEIRRKVEDTPVEEDCDLQDIFGNVPWPASDPAHYRQGDIECIDYIKSVLSKEGYIGYLQGNITKYLHRWKDKNGVEDLDKAHVYLNWLIEEVE